MPSEFSLDNGHIRAIMAPRIRYTQDEIEKELLRRSRMERWRLDRVAQRAKQGVTMQPRLVKKEKTDE